MAVQRQQQQQLLHVVVVVAVVTTVMLLASAVVPVRGKLSSGARAELMLDFVKDPEHTLDNWDLMGYAKPVGDGVGKAVQLTADAQVCV